MTNFFSIDPRVTDPDILDDMNLAAHVVQQAAGPESAEALTQEQIDELLGVRRPQPEA